MLIAVAMVVGGLVGLSFGADWLLKGSASIARIMGIPQVVIGLTIIALGTSAPELITGIRAVMAGEPGIVMGNAVGSNIANLGLVLGIGAMMGRIAVPRSFTWKDGGLMLGVTLLCFILASDGMVSLVDGIILVSCLVPLTWFALKRGLPEEAGVTAQKEPVNPRSVWTAVGFVAVGLALLAIGSGWLVDGAVTLATMLGVSSTLIGATVVAFGTSAPELAATIAAARQKHYDMMLGNLIGSCQLNLAAIVGIPALIAATTPRLGSGLEVDPAMLSYHFPALLTVSLIAWLFMYFKQQIFRRQGLVLVLIYLAYIVLGILIAK